jgi:hypothetical protein
MSSVMAGGDFWKGAESGFIVGAFNAGKHAAQNYVAKYLPSVDGYRALKRRLVKFVNDMKVKDANFESWLASFGGDHMDYADAKMTTNDWNLYIGIVGSASGLVSGTALKVYGLIGVSTAGYKAGRHPSKGNTVGLAKSIPLAVSGAPILNPIMLYMDNSGYSDKAYDWTAKFLDSKGIPIYPTKK